jgi:hypothetical protein
VTVGPGVEWLLLHWWLGLTVEDPDGPLTGTASEAGRRPLRSVQNGDRRHVGHC